MEIAAPHQVMPVVESTQTSAARFLVRDVAESIGFNEEDSYRAGLVATELATNLVNHAKGGEILVRAIDAAGEPQVEVLSIDRGPGIRDLPLAMTDGYSTTGTQGSGLGAVRRLSDLFDMHSNDGRGTVVLARLSRKRCRIPRADDIEFAGVSVAHEGEPVCGDGWSVQRCADRVCVGVADGLGHGVHAAEAARTALEAFSRACGSGPARALEAMHDATRHTRGTAASIAEIFPARGVVTCGGVGNVATSVVVPDLPIRHAVSIPGTLGHQARTFREFPYPWSRDSLLVMHSDGLITHWSLDGLDGLTRRHPAVMAAVLYRDFNRQRDDVTVVVGRAAR